jgi:hypothetical protein
MQVLHSYRNKIKTELKKKQQKTKRTTTTTATGVATT